MPKFWKRLFGRKRQAQTSRVERQELIERSTVQLSDAALIQCVLEFYPRDPQNEFACLLKMKRVNKTFDHILTYCATIWDKRQMTFTAKNSVKHREMITTYHKYYGDMMFNLGQVCVQGVSFGDYDHETFLLLLESPDIYFCNCKFVHEQNPAVINNCKSRIVVSKCSVSKTKTPDFTTVQSGRDCRYKFNQRMGQIVLEKMSAIDCQKMLMYLSSNGITVRDHLVVDFPLNSIRDLCSFSYSYRIHENFHSTCVTLDCRTMDQSAPDEVYSELSKGSVITPHTQATFTGVAEQLWISLGNAERIYFFDSNQYIQIDKNADTSDKHVQLLTTNGVGQDQILTKDERLESSYYQEKLEFLRLMNQASETKLKESLSDNIRQQVQEELWKATRLLESEQEVTDRKLKQLQQHIMILDQTTPLDHFHLQVVL